MCRYSALCIQFYKQKISFKNSQTVQERIHAFDVVFNSYLIEVCFVHLIDTLKHVSLYQAKVLEPLGAVTSGSQFLEPDGNI